MPQPVEHYEQGLSELAQGHYPAAQAQFAAAQAAVAIAGPHRDPLELIARFRVTEPETAASTAVTDDVVEYPEKPCRSCGRMIIWAESVRGKAMPVDAEPHPDGGTITLTPQPGSSPVATVGAAMLGLRRSHFSTCPDATAWRGR